MFMTWADEIKEEGIEQGTRKGIEKMRDVVLQLTAQRFGELPERTRRTIASITSLDDLAEMAKKVLVVDSLEELLAS